MIVLEHQLKYYVALQQVICAKFESIFNLMPKKSSFERNINSYNLLEFNATFKHFQLMQAKEGLKNQFTFHKEVGQLI